MLETLTEDILTFTELSPEEKAQRGILGRLYGPIASFNMGTRNGRRYSDELWNKVFENDIVKELLANGGIPAELDHPQDREETCSEKIAAMMPEPPKKDKDGHLCGYFDIIDTPCGRIAAALARYGFHLGISSRGSGDVITGFDGQEDVDPDTYTLNAFDIVLIPALKDARMTFTESLKDSKKKSLKESLEELVANANDNDKKVMQETINNLNLANTQQLNENIALEPGTELTSKKGNKIVITAVKPSISEYNGEAYIDVEYDYETIDGQKGHSSTGSRNIWAMLNEDLEESLDDRDSDFNKLYNEYGPNEFINKLILFLDNNGLYDEFLDNELTKSKLSAVDDNEAGVDIEDLEEALKSKRELEKEMTELQEKLSVCYAKEAKQEDVIAKNKKAISNLSLKAGTIEPLRESIEALKKDCSEAKSKISEYEKQNKQLKVQLANVDKSAASLKESATNLNNEIKGLQKNNEILKNKVTKLTENLTEAKKDNELAEKQYSQKISNSNKLVEKYKKMANSAVNRYIESQALKLGVKKEEIKNRLPESYTFDDIDSICEELQDLNLNMSRLPFNRLTESSVRITSPVKSTPVAEEEDLSDLYALAGLK